MSIKKYCNEYFRIDSNTDSGLILIKSRNTKGKVEQGVGTLSAKGYWRVKVKGISTAAHHIVYAMYWDEWDFFDSLKEQTHDICHIDDNRGNNSPANLLYAPRSWNAQMKPPKEGQLYKGTSFDKTKNKYRAQIFVDGKNKSLGSFSLEATAARAYDDAVRKYHCNYAYVNFTKDYETTGKNGWDVGVEGEPLWCEGSAPCFKLWKTKGRFTALLDADMLPYIVGFLHSYDEWEGLLLKASAKGLKTNSTKFFKWLRRQKPAKEAINHCDSLVNSWTINAGADSAILYLTAGLRNFRFDVAFSKEYKGTRKQDKPPYYSLLRWHLAKKHKAVVSYTAEADDLMAIEQYSRNELLVLEGAKQGSKRSKQFSDTIIVTKDKDLRMIAGWHSNPSINRGEPFWSNRFGTLEPEYHPKGHDKEGKMKKLGGTGLSFFYAQLLMGDSVDNYSGVPGLGMVSTFEHLRVCKNVKQLHSTVEELYKKKFGIKPFVFKCWTNAEVRVGWKDMLVEQGRLAWMQTQANELWEPEHVLPEPKSWQHKDTNKLRKKADKEAYV